MTAQSVTCPPELVLDDFGLGKLDAASADTVSRHIETCADCRQRVASLSGDSFVGRLRQAGGAQPVENRRTGVAGESPANAARSTPRGNLSGSPGREDGLTRPSRSADDPALQDGPGSPSFVAAPPELANYAEFELIKELGQGGMGTVYLAKNRMMDRLEVLKVISQSLLDHPGAIERFQQEIRSAAKLAHPNIVAAYSVRRPGDLLVFAMEYVRGQDLSEVVKLRGRLPVANAAFYIHQVANGLQHAFEKGMVHRDIKPNNLMLAIEGKKHVVKILDFGLAKASSEKGAETGLTKSGQMLGTPDYVAPEQTLAAHRADIRADIYSLGCTLYFLLSGGPPFQEKSLYAILEAHHKRDPKPLNLVRPEVPAELAAVVAKMMAKDPAMRYRTPLEVARALVPFFKPGQTAAAFAPADTVHSRPAAQTKHGLGPATPGAPITPPTAPYPVPVAPRVTVMTPLPAVRPAEMPALSIEAHRSATRRRRGWSSLRSWQRWTAVGGAAAMLLLGIVLLVRTPRGTIKIALSEPDAKVSVAVDGNHIDIRGPDEPLSIDVGEHHVSVKGDGFETITQGFKVTRGKNAPLTIKLVRLDEPLPPKPAQQPGPPTDVVELSPASGAKPSADPPVEKVSEVKRFPFVNPAPGRGHWSIEGQELVQSSLDNNVTILFGDPDWGDFDFSVDLQRDGGPDACGMRLWYQDDWNTGVLWLASVGNSLHRVDEVYGGNANCLAKSQGSFAAGKWYHLEVRMRGTHGDCFLDGADLMSFDLKSRPHERLGLTTWASAYRFRNIVVKAPDGTVLLEGLPDLDTPRLAQVALLNGKDLDGWLFAERPGGLEFDDAVVRLTNANDYFITKRHDFKNYLLRLTLSASKDTEAFLVQRKQGPPGAGTAITSRIFDDGTSIRAGMQWINFGTTEEIGVKPASVPYDQFFVLELQMKDKVVVMSIDGIFASDVIHPACHDEGALGLMLRKGKVAIRQIEVKELPPTPKEKAPEPAAVRDGDRFRGPSLPVSAHPADLPKIVGETAPGFSIPPPVSSFGMDEDTGRVYPQFRVPQNAKELEFYVHGGDRPGLYVALNTAKKRSIELPGTIPMRQGTLHGMFKNCEAKQPPWKLSMRPGEDGDSSAFMVSGSLLTIPRPTERLRHLAEKVLEEQRCGTASRSTAGFL
jgi:serine/threonine protein kinase